MLQAKKQSLLIVLLYRERNFNWVSVDVNYDMIMNQNDIVSLMIKAEDNEASTLSLMGWGVENDGLSVIFDKTIPEFITKELPIVLSNFKMNNFFFKLTPPAELNPPKFPSDLITLWQGTLGEYGFIPQAFATARADLGLFMPIATCL